MSTTDIWNLESKPKPSEKSPSQNLLPLSEIPEIKNYTGKNCNEFGIVDINCFADSFNNCNLAKIQYDSPSIDGGSVTIIALINTEINCSVDLFHDSRKDWWGAKDIVKFSCPKVELYENYLSMPSCIDEFGKDNYVFNIYK